MQVTKGTPLATIEGDEDGAIGEDSLAGDSIAKCVRQDEFRQGSTNLNGGPWVRGCVKTYPTRKRRSKRGNDTNLDHKRP